MDSGTGIDGNRIVVGNPLPFSVFTTDGKLLLAQGQIVETDRLRDMLVRNGRRCEVSGPDGEAGKPRPEGEAELRAGDSPLEQLCKAYEASRGGQHLSISMARSETEQAFPVQLIGVHKHYIIVTAPVHPDGSLVAVLNEQTWLCRTFQMTSAFRFTALVVKACFEPYPCLYLKLKNEVEHRQARGAPRARVSLRAVLHAPDALPCVISDLSTSGARIAVETTLTSLEKGRPARLTVTLCVLQSKYELSLNAVVVNVFGPTDSRHPKTVFYGLKFDAPTEKDHLVLHGFVGERLVSELHLLWQMLRLAAS
jgi:PilZ domain/Flagellar protein YcgR